MIIKKEQVCRGFAPCTIVYPVYRRATVMPLPCQLPSRNVLVPVQQLGTENKRLESRCGHQGLRAKIYAQEVKSEVVADGGAEELALDGIFNAFVCPGRVEGKFA